MYALGESVFQIDDAGGFVEGPISLDHPVGTLPIVDDARWSAELTSNSLAATIVWILLLVVLQAALWPVVKRVFAGFPDKGWAFGRILTLLSAGYLMWIMASMEVIAFRAVWCAVAVAIVALGSWVFGRKLTNWPGGFKQDRRWYENHSIVIAEAIFWSVFALFLLYRFINPDSYHPSWGGEKPMEFAHINAILRSAHFPPYDPWYADGTLNYYYYGMYLVAFMMKLTGIPSEIAFNLAQPTMMALLATGAFSVVSALSYSLTSSRTISRIGGQIGVVLVSFSGNLVVAARLVSSITESAPPLSDYLHWFWNPTRIVPFTINEFPYFTGTYADLHAHVVALPITMLLVGLCFAIAQHARSVLIAVRRPSAFPRLTATFACGLVFLALAVGSLFVTNAWDVPTYAALIGVSMLLATRGISSLPQRLGVSAGLALAVGLIAYIAVLPFSRNYVALYGDIRENRDVSPLVSIEAHFGVFFLITTFGLSFLLSRLWDNPPFICRPWVLLGGLSAILLARWYVADGTADAIESVDGLTVLVVVIWMLFGVLLAVRDTLDFGLSPWIARGVVVIGWIATIGAIASDRAAFGLFLGLGVAAGLIWLMIRSPAERFAASLIAAAMFIGAGVELVYLVDALTVTDFYRMNTVFKFYNGMWIMLAVSGAALVAWMIKGATETTVLTVVESASESTALPVDEEPMLAQNEGHSSPDELPVNQNAEPGSNETGTAHVSPPLPQVRGLLATSWAQAGLFVSSLAIIASLAYPVFATGTRLNQHFAQSGPAWTLNALDWMSYGTIPEYGSGGVVYSYEDDRAVIDWFNSEVPGSPVIAEASIDQYACAGSRIAIHTGLPGVVGWVWHESQQRDWVDLYQRQDDLRTLFSSADPATIRAIIGKYRIEYIVVGDLERTYPTNNCHSTDNSAGIEGLSSMLGGDLEVAFTSGETVVYRVVQP